MGYNTLFEGQISIVSDMTDRNAELLMEVVQDSKIDSLKEFCKAHAIKVKPLPAGWCNWKIMKWISDINYSIFDDEGGKAYYAEEWLCTLVNDILKPAGYDTEGVIKWSGEEYDDLGMFVVEDGKVITCTADIVYSKPDGTVVT